MDDITEPFRERMLDEKKRKDVSYSNLAVMTGITKATLQRELVGKSKMSLETALKIAKAFGYQIIAQRIEP